MFLIRTDSLTELPRNYNLISRHQMKSSMPFHINNLTLSWTEEGILQLVLKYRTSHSHHRSDCVKRRRLELLMRAFTLGAQFGPRHQSFSQPLFFQRDNIIKLDIVSLRFSHYDLGHVKPKFR